MADTPSPAPRPVPGRNRTGPPERVWPEDEPGLPPLEGVVAALEGFVDVGDRSPLEIELLVSDFLAQLGAGQAPPAPGEPDHVELLNGIVELCLLHLDRSPPRVVLDFLWVLDAFDPGWVHWPLHERLAASALPARPAWAMDVGQAEVRTAHVVRHETGDGFDVAFVARHRSAERDHVVAVYVDRTFGGLATDVLVHDDAEEYLGLSRAEPGMAVHDVDPATAVATADPAVAATFAAGVPPAVSEGFASRWAVLEQHLARCPSGGDPLPAPAAAPPEDQAALVDRFLAGPDGAAARADRDVLLEAVGFVTDELGGDPLRWSPAVTQLVLGGWMPFAVEDPDVAGRFGQVLRAFVPWAQREQGWGDRYVAATLEAIDAVEGTGTSSGGRVEILEQALAEGVDLDDEEALDAFLDRYLGEGG
ncbi:MAG TPA: hypothetical protein VFV42_06835 [Acidimicrobiales bacterium]|nr:hypothetical protein [Acidimicrobiales bacterium]